MRAWLFGIAMLAAGPALAQNYGAGAPTVGIPNGLSGPGGTVTFSPAPPMPDFGAPVISGTMPVRRGLDRAVPRPRPHGAAHRRRAPS